MNEVLAMEAVDTQCYNRNITMEAYCDRRREALLRLLVCDSMPVDIYIIM